MRKQIIMTAALLAFVFTGVFYFAEKSQWKKREVKLSNEIQSYKKAETELKDRISQLENLASEVPMQMKYYIRPHNQISSINMELQPGSPVVSGPIAKISTNITEPVSVIEKKNGWAKVKAEWWIPEWYLVENTENIEQIKVLPATKMFIKEQCSLKLYPDDNAPIIFENLFKGKVIYVSKQYRDWYYITLQQVYDIPAYTEGWVKVSQVGSKDEVEPFEGYLKIGSKAYIVYEFNEIKNCSSRNIEIVKDKRPVYIVKKQGNYACVDAAGGWQAWVKLSDIEY